MAVLSMIKQEFHRLGVLLSVQSGRLHVTDACGLIGLQRRQVFRLLRCLKRDGAASLLSKRRGKPSNHRLPAEVRTLALSIVREPISRLWPDPVVAAPSRGAGSRQRRSWQTRDLARLDDCGWAVYFRSARSVSSPLRPPPHPTRQTGADRQVEDPVRERNPEVSTPR